MLTTKELVEVQFRWLWRTQGMICRVRKRFGYMHSPEIFTRLVLACSTANQFTTQQKPLPPHILHFFPHYSYRKITNDDTKPWFVSKPLVLDLFLLPDPLVLRARTRRVPQNCQPPTLFCRCLCSYGWTQRHDSTLSFVLPPIPTRQLLSLLLGGNHKIGCTLDSCSHCESTQFSSRIYIKNLIGLYGLYLY